MWSYDRANGDLEMLMQPQKKQAEIERAHVKSLALVAATFFIANIVLVVGFSASAHAQAMQAASPALELAKMLASPENKASFSLGSTQVDAAAAMVAGLLVMGAGSVSFLRHIARDLDQASRSRL